METTEQEARVPCPYCKEMILQGALKCKECGTSLRRQSFANGDWVWARNLPDRKVLGVAACIAANFRVSATLVRLVFILLTFASFLGLFIYLFLAAVIPAEKDGRSLFEAAVDAMGAAFDNLRTRPANAVATTNAAAPTTQPASPVEAGTQEPPPASGAPNEGN